MLCLHVYLCIACVLDGYRGQQRRASDLLGLELDSWELPCALWELSLILLEVQPVLLTIELPLHHHLCILFMWDSLSLSLMLTDRAITGWLASSRDSCLPSMAITGATSSFFLGTWFFRLVLQLLIQLLRLKNIFLNLVILPGRLIWKVFTS